jgi:hypothetical protein
MRNTVPGQDANSPKPPFDHSSLSILNFTRSPATVTQFRRGQDWAIYVVGVLRHGTFDIDAFFMLIPPSISLQSASNTVKESGIQRFFLLLVATFALFLATTVIHFFKFAGSDISIFRKPVFVRNHVQNIGRSRPCGHRICGIATGLQLISIRIRSTVFIRRRCSVELERRRSNRIRVFLFADNSKFSCTSELQQSN